MGNVGRELTAHLLSGFHFFLDRHLLLLDLIDQRCKLRILIDLRTLQIDRIDRVYDLLSNTEGKNCRDHKNQDQDPEDRTDSDQCFLNGTYRTTQAKDRTILAFSCIVHGGLATVFRGPYLPALAVFHGIGNLCVILLVIHRKLELTIIKNITISVDPCNAVLIAKSFQIVFSADKKPLLRIGRFLFQRAISIVFDLCVLYPEEKHCTKRQNRNTD